MNVRCPHCREGYRVADEHRDKVLRCAKCRRMFRAAPAPRDPARSHATAFAVAAASAALVAGAGAAAAFFLSRAGPRDTAAPPAAAEVVRPAEPAPPPPAAPELLPPPGITGDPPAPKSPRERAVAWAEENNALGRAHGVVKDMADALAAKGNEGDDFALGVEGGLLQSKKTTWLVGRGGEFLVAEAPPAGPDGQGFGFTVTPLPRPSVRRGSTAVRLDGLKVAPAEGRITGEVTCRRPGEGGAPAALRLIVVRNGTTHTDLSPLGAVPPAENVTLPFTVAAAAGPVLLLAEVVAGEAVLSNAVATAVVVTAPPVVAAPPPKPAGLAGLEVKLPPGWRGEFNRFSRRWTFARDAARVTVGELLDDVYDADACAARLRRRDLVDVEDDAFAFAEITAKEKLPGGFLVKGVTLGVNDRREKRLGIVMVRTLGGTRVICQGTALPDEAARAEAVGLFAGARLR